MSTESGEKSVSLSDVDAEDVGADSEQDGPSESEEPPDESLPLDQVFGILKNQRRRRVLEFLYEAGGQVSLSDVAEQIAAWENDKDVRQISSSERKRVYVGLYQCHLPKMDDAGVVSFNKPRGTMTLGENADTVYQYLDTDDEVEEPPWHRYSVALSVGSVLALGVALLVRPMTAVPVLTLVVSGTVLTLSAYSLVAIDWVRRNRPDDD